MSVWQLKKLGYRVEFHNREAKIHDDDGKLIGTSEKTRGDLFYKDLSEETCMFVQQEDVWLCQKRLCHVNFDNFVNISKMKEVRGLPKLKKPDNVMCK